MIITILVICLAAKQLDLCPRLGINLVCLIYLVRANFSVFWHICSENIQMLVI